MVYSICLCLLAVAVGAMPDDADHWADAGAAAAAADAAATMVGPGDDVYGDCAVTRCGRTTTGATCEQGRDRVTCTAPDGEEVINEYNRDTTTCWWTCHEPLPGPACPVAAMVPGTYEFSNERWGWGINRDCEGTLDVECGATTCEFTAKSTCSTPAPAPSPWTPPGAPDEVTYVLKSAGTVPCHDLGTAQPTTLPWWHNWPTQPPLTHRPTPAPTPCEDMTDAPWPGTRSEKDCDWLLTRTPSKQTKLCSNTNRFGKWCPVSCGRC
mmetsp:Transcript_19620/g.59344  ORF Transcript_19620/g.59344 Transcript_19620/m.59344 type:complete len:267 (-) Transcript_19620:54-854(-)